jgi:phasin
MAGARKPAKTVASRTALAVQPAPMSIDPVDAPEVSITSSTAPSATTSTTTSHVVIDVPPSLIVVETSLTDLGEYVRKSAEDNLEKTRAAYERFRASAEQATSSLETSYTTANEGLNALGAKTIEAFRLNANASFELIKALISASSLSEAIELQNEHARKQFEILSAQVKDISCLAQKVVSDTAEPLKSSLSKAFAA